MALSGWPAQTDDTGTKRDGTILNKTFMDAVRASVEAALDGGAYLPNFDGLAIGYVGAAAADEIRLGDANLKLDFDGGGASIPALQFDAGDRIQYDRGSNSLSFIIGSVSELQLNAFGLIVTDGLTVGFATNPTADRIMLGDANLHLDFGGGTVPTLTFDATDFFEYTRATNTLRFLVGGAAVLTLTATGVTFTVGGSSGGFSSLGLFNSFKGGNVASVADIVPTGNLFHVTGTTTITSITSTGILAGTVITIIFDGVLTFTDGSNLKLAGNFVTTADDTITLVYDGTNWYEIARAVA